MTNQADKTRISSLYQQTQTSGPSKQIDQAILKAAKEEISGQSASVVKFRWRIPMSIAAALFAAILILQNINVQDYQIPESGDNEHIVSAGKVAPEILLDKISKHINENDMDSAQEEYQLFRELFPEYKIDYTKHPELKKIKK